MVNMPSLVPGFRSPDELSPETLYVRSLKEQWAKRGNRRVKGGSVVFRLDEEMRERFTKAVHSHQMSMTEVLTMYIEEVVPLFEKAKFITVDGYKPAKTGYRSKKPRTEARS
jgi:hypothetical protein